MAKKSNPNRKEKYKAQFERTERNRERKLLRHVGRHPTDLQANKKLERV